MNVAQFVLVTVIPEQADGSPGKIDAPPTYPVDTPGILTLAPAADGLSCQCTGLAPGTCTVTPTVLANGNTITGTPVQFTVSPAPEGFATQLVVSVGPVTDPVLAKMAKK
jgi:hypothetical protein